MSEADWDGCSWDLQRSYLEGLDEDESVPFRIEFGGQLPTGEQGPQVREGVDPGVQVISITDMRQQLEAARSKGGG